MRQILLCLILLSGISSLRSQTIVPILERRVTIKVVKQTLGKTLTIISETANFNFSYNNSVLKAGKIVSIMAENRTVKEVLDQLFNNELSYQQIGNHLVLQKKPVTKQTNVVQGDSKKDVKYTYIVTGYIRDLQSGDGIPGVSVYEKQTLTGTLSGDFGYYTLRVVSRNPEISVKVSGHEYRDTMIRIRYSGNGISDCHMNLLSLKPAPEEEEHAVDSPVVVKELPKDSIVNDTVPVTLVWEDSSAHKDTFRIEDTRAGKWVISTFQKINEKNIRDSFNRDWQFTLFPPIGSNGHFSGLVKNRISFNLLAGYNGGVDGAEFGAFLNVLKKDMNGAQFAGFGNLVGGKTTGAQFAGFFNHNIGDVNAFQGAGFYNYNHAAFTGAQFAGFVNLNRGAFEGMQAAGFMNIARTGSSLVQGAGFMNIASGEGDMVQGAGFMNIAEGMTGVQGAGFMNIAHHIDGLQVAGFMNIGTSKHYLVQGAGFLNVADEINGGQLAGFMNIAKKVNGFQIGLFNFADTVNGYVLGLFNFIGNGMHQLELSYNENSQYGLAYRSGMERFYSVVNINAQKQDLDSGTLISYGFGVGKRFRISDRFHITTDISCNQMTIDFDSDHLNLHNRLNASLEVSLFKGFSLFGGGVLNHAINDTRNYRYETRFKPFGSDALWSMQSGSYAQKAWLGWQFGLRLF